MSITFGVKHCVTLGKALILFGLGFCIYRMKGVDWDMSPQVIPSWKPVHGRVKTFSKNVK